MNDFHQPPQPRQYITRDRAGMGQLLRGVAPELEHKAGGGKESLDRIFSKLEGMVEEVRGHNQNQKRLLEACAANGTFDAAARITQAMNPLLVRLGNDFAGPVKIPLAGSAAASVAEAMLKAEIEMGAVYKNAVAHFRDPGEDGKDRAYFFIVCGACARVGASSDLKFVLDKVLEQWAAGPLRQDMVEDALRYLPLPASRQDEWQALATREIAMIYDEAWKNGSRPDFRNLARVGKFQDQVRAYWHRMLPKATSAILNDAAADIKTALASEGAGRGAIKEKRIKEVMSDVLEAHAKKCDIVAIEGYEIIIFTEKDGDVYGELVRQALSRVKGEIAMKALENKAAPAEAPLQQKPARPPVPRKRETYVPKKGAIPPRQFFERLLETDPRFRDAPRNKIYEKLVKSAHKRRITDMTGVDEDDVHSIVKRARDNCPKEETRKWFDAILDAKIPGSRAKV